MLPMERREECKLAGRLISWFFQLLEDTCNADPGDNQHVEAYGAISPPRDHPEDRPSREKGSAQHRPRHYAMPAPLYLATLVTDIESAASAALGPLEQVVQIGGSLCQREDRAKSTRAADETLIYALTDAARHHDLRILFPFEHRM